MEKWFLLVAHLIVCLGLVSVSLPSFGQAVFGSILGTVTDPSAAAVPKANITVIDQSKGTTEQTTTNESGNYSVTHLIPVVYTVRVEAQGFTTLEFKDITVSADTGSRVDARFQMGSTGEQVEVTAEAPQLKIDRADVSIEFNQKYVDNPAIANRNFVWFELLPPTTATQKCWSHAVPENPQGGQQIFANGQDFSATSYKLDGTDDQDPILGIIVVNPNLDAIQEAKTGLQNYDAEFGMALGSSRVEDLLIGSWQIYGTTTWGSGLPWTPSFSSCGLDEGVGACRPNIGSGSSHTGAGSFNPITHQVPFFTPVSSIQGVTSGGPFTDPGIDNLGNIGFDSFTGPFLGHASPQDKQKGSMPGMDMSGMGEMSDMGPTMAAMAGHVYMTPLGPKQSGDEEKAKALVAKVKLMMERYKDYRKALADGYFIAHPKVRQPQYHFMNKANSQEADVSFDPDKPTALLYRQTPMLEYKLEGAMYTASPDATEEELNQRIPLSIARWHRHLNFCEAPEDRVKEYLGAHPKFGMFGSIKTKEACEAERGIFHPYLFTWMVHVFPYEDDFKEVFSMNDDVAHVH